jgi:hypothetical protein
MTGVGAGVAFFFVLVFGLAIASLVFMIVSLVDMVKRPDWQWKLAGQEKVLWIVLVLLINAFAIVSLIYWFNIRKRLIAVEQAAAAGQYGAGYMTPGGWQPSAAAMGYPMTGTAPPGWLPDPSGQHRYRWWDGANWTEHVSEGSPS